MANVLSSVVVFVVLVISACVSCASENISSLNHEQLFDNVPKKSESDRESIKVLGSRLFEYKKPLNLSSVPGVSLECHHDFLHYLEALESFELWALKMYDANGQLSTGILSGNVNMYGDFQECLSLTARDGLRFQGKHCYAELQPTVRESATYLNFLRRLAQSFDLMKSTFKDTGHVFGRFSSITYGVCVPSTCSHRDVATAVRHYLNEFTTDTGLRFDVQVKKEMCQVDDTGNKRITLDRGERIAIGLFVLLCCVSLASSAYDDRWGDHKVSWLTAFSVSKNWRQLTSIKRSSDDIQVVHGIRFLNAMLIFLCHKSVEAFMPWNNRTEMAINAFRPGSIMLRMCALYTDVFLMLSGMLVAYSLAKKMRSGEKIKIFQEYMGRYIRVMPNMISTMLLTVYVIPNFVEQTPHRANVIETPARLCKEFGWRNLLLVHNWFKFEEMCSLHTHHVGSDFALFLVAPFILALLWKSPKRGASLVILLATASTFARFYETYTRELMYFVPFGAKLSNLLATANNMYKLPTHRFTVYGIGLLLGFILRKYDGFKLSKLQFFLGQLANAAMMLIVIACGLAMTGIDVDYNVVLHSLYSAFAPILYCLHVGWIIFSSHQGHKSSFTRLLEWRGFAITTKFCYAFYLVQIPILQASIANTKDIRYYHATSIINLNEVFVIVVASVIMTLFIETPFNNIKNLLLRRDTRVDENFNIDSKQEKTE